MSQAVETTPLVKGTAVVSLGDGAKLGTVDRVYLDPERKRIVGFSFHAGGLFAKTSGVVDIADVHGIGPDAVTIDDASAIRSQLVLDARECDLIELDDLLRRKVITEGGAFVGQVAAIRFGEESHGLTAIDVSPGAHQETRSIPADRIQRIGTDLIVIADAAEQRPVVQQHPAVGRLVRVA